jgi:hypothetical protein
MGKVDSIDITGGYEVRDMVTEIRDDYSVEAIPVVVRAEIT